MASKRDFDRTIEAGKQNLSTLELIHNWCSHAKIEKHGGVGLIEAETGLPIGHHSVKCDHASESGLATWDLREAALDFYDRNCIDCTFRKPVGLPNLSSLIQKRDDRITAETKRKEIEQAELAKALQERRATRSKLREVLSPIAGAILDHIEEFDEHRTEEHSAQLCESANLAPDHFEPELVNYIFDLAEKEKWFSDIALTVLQAIKADPSRLTNLAFLTITYSSDPNIAADIILSHVTDIDNTRILPALPSIINLAKPHAELFAGYQRTEHPQLLQTLWENNRPAVESGINKLFNSRKIWHIDLAARGILAIAKCDQSVLSQYTIVMISKFIRSRYLIDDFDETEFSDDLKKLNNLLDAIIFAFTNEPTIVDDLIQNFMVASDDSLCLRGYHIYHMALSRHNRVKDKIISGDSLVHRISFRRILWAATTTKSDAVLREVQATMYTQPYELEEIARLEIDSLLGSLLILDDLLRKHDELPRIDKTSALQQLESQNHRSLLLSLMSSIINWASASAKNNMDLVKKIVDLIEIIPEGRDDLKGFFLGSIEYIGASVEGLNLILPYVYYNLVGSSVLGRAYAATAVGKLRYQSQNIPPLIYEAFVNLLADPYVAVHKSAVHALRRINLPEKFSKFSANALFDLICYYSKQPNEDRFIVECITLFVSKLKHFGNIKSNIAGFIAEILINMDPIYVKSELRWLSYALGDTQEFADLLLKYIPLFDDYYNNQHDDISLINELSVDIIFAKRAQFENVGKEIAPQKPWLAANIIEVLTRVGAWAEAQHIAQAGLDKCEPTIRNLSRRFFCQFMAIATEYEEAIAEGRVDDLAPLEKKWDDNVKLEQEYRIDVERRNSRARFPYPI